MGILFRRVTDRDPVCMIYAIHSRFMFYKSGSEKKLI